MLVAISPRALLTSSCGISHTGILNVSNDTPPGSCNTVHATAFNRIEMVKRKFNFRVPLPPVIMLLWSPMITGISGIETPI